MSIPAPIISCGPIELRMVTPRSAQQLYALARDPEVSRMLQWSPHVSIDDSLEYIHDSRSLWERGRAWLPGIFDRESGALVGCTGISNVDRINRRGEVGTWLGVPWQGRGFNLPVKAAVVSFAFEHLDLARLELLTRADNARSIAALRSLPGIREEGSNLQRINVDGTLHDAIGFALLASEHDAAAWPEVQVEAPAPPATGR